MHKLLAATRAGRTVAPLPPPHQIADSGAVIVGDYRYTLWRTWEQDRPRILFILLNPSRADAQLDDPTLRRCIGFARAYGYGSVELVNTFAYRATSPRVLTQVADPVGPENDQHISQAAGRAQRIVVAWGALGCLLGRDQAVLSLLEAPAWCLGLTASNAPRHPLYMRRDAPLVPYPVPAVRR